jgi:hypothetical protein
MVILFAVLLCVLPAHRAFSLDALIRPRLRSATVPYAAVFVLRVQVEIILIYAGIVKITEDWLKGEPLASGCAPRPTQVPMGALFAYDWVILAGAWGTILLHIVGAPLLLWERTRLPVFALYCVFHMANAYFFNIGIFPWLTIGATLILFAPDWPQRTARWLAGRFEALPPPAPAPVRGRTRDGCRCWRCWARALDRGAGGGAAEASRLPDRGALDRRRPPLRLADADVRPRGPRLLRGRDAGRPRLGGRARGLPERAPGPRHARRGRT